MHQVAKSSLNCVVRKRIHHAVSIIYMLVAVMLVFVNAIVSKVVYRQYRGDSKIGPVNAYSFSEFSSCRD